MGIIGRLLDTKQIISLSPIIGFAAVRIPFLTTMLYRRYENEILLVLNIFNQHAFQDEIWKLVDIDSDAGPRDFFISRVLLEVHRHGFADMKRDVNPRTGYLEPSFLINQQGVEQMLRPRRRHARRCGSRVFYIDNYKLAALRELAKHSKPKFEKEILPKIDSCPSYPNARFREAMRAMQHPMNGALVKINIFYNEKMRQDPYRDTFEITEAGRAMLTRLGG